LGSQSLDPGQEIVTIARGATEFGFLTGMWTLRTIGFWAATALASLAVLLVIIDGWLVTSNVAIRADVTNRQQFINQSVQLSRLNQELVNELGGFAAKNNAAIKQLLAESGITVVGQAPAPGQAAPTAAGQATPAPAAPANPAGPATPVPLKKP
jgi:hypothetical protein